jgi:hypothetical protein
MGIQGLELEPAEPEVEEVEKPVKPEVTPNEE